MIILQAFVELNNIFMGEIATSCLFRHEIKLKIECVS